MNVQSCCVQWFVITIVSLFLSFYPFFILSSFAGEDEAAKAAPVPVCKDAQYASGRTSSIESVASLSAIISWIVLARREFGQEYEQWQNAQGKSVKCKKMKIFFLCEANGRPCNMPKYQ